MPAVTRINVDPSAGHCFPPRPADTTPNTSVFVNDILATVVGAHYPSHSCGDSSHDGTASEGSDTVFFENIAVHRIGDMISCGDVSASGSPDVFIGD